MIFTITCFLANNGSELSCRSLIKIRFWTLGSFSEKPAGIFVKQFFSNLYAFKINFLHHVIIFFVSFQNNCIQSVYTITKFIALWVSSYRLASNDCHQSLYEGNNFKLLIFFTSNVSLEGSKFKADSNYHSY